MPYGVHFVSRDENPVGFLVWRIATVAQDGAEYAEESFNADQTMVDRSKDRLLATPFHTAPVAGAAPSGPEPTSLESLVMQAKQLGEGKDPHDQPTITALEAMLAQAVALTGGARQSSDAEMGKLTHTFEGPVERLMDHLHPHHDQDSSDPA